MLTIAIISSILLVFKMVSQLVNASTESNDSATLTGRIIGTLLVYAFFQSTIWILYAN